MVGFVSTPLNSLQSRISPTRASWEQSFPCAGELFERELACMAWHGMAKKHAGNCSNDVVLRLTESMCQGTSDTP